MRMLKAYCSRCNKFIPLNKVRIKGDKYSYSDLKITCPDCKTQLNVVGKNIENRT